VHLCFLKKVGGRCGYVYGAKGAVDRKSLGTTVLESELHLHYRCTVLCCSHNAINCVAVSLSAVICNHDGFSILQAYSLTKYRTLR
jgi:hypothetical protein